MTVETGTVDLCRRPTGLSHTLYGGLTDKLECINKLSKKGKKEKMGLCLLETEVTGHCFTYQYELINYTNDPPTSRDHLSLFWDYPSPGGPLLIISYLGGISSLMLVSVPQRFFSYCFESGEVRDS